MERCLALQVLLSDVMAEDARLIRRVTSAVAVRCLGAAEVGETLDTVNKITIHHDIKKVRPRI